MLTLRALVLVPAEGGRPAEGQFSQHALHLRYRLTTVPLQIVRRVLPQQVDYAERLAPLLGGCFGGGSFFESVLQGGSWFGSTQRGH